MAWFLVLAFGLVPLTGEDVPLADVLESSSTAREAVNGVANDLVPTDGTASVSGSGLSNADPQQWIPTYEFDSAPPDDGAFDPLDLPLEPAPDASDGEDDVETTPPTIRAIAPVPASTISTLRPLVSIGYVDESGVDPADLVIELDGVRLAVTPTAEGASTMPPRDLRPGAHSIDVRVSDVYGNEATLSWSFTVREPASTGSCASSLHMPGLPAAALSVGCIRFDKGDARAPVLLPLPDAPSAPSGLQVLAAFDLAPDEPGVGRATLDFRVDAGWLQSTGASPARLLLLHHTGGAWDPVALRAISGNSTTWRYEADVGSFSPFALAIDVRAPVVWLETPIGTPTSAQPIPVSVGIADGGGVASRTLRLDGAPIPATSTPQGLEATLRPLAPGDHTLDVLATDVAGNTAKETWTFAVAPVSLVETGEDLLAPTPTPEPTPASTPISDDEASGSPGLAVVAAVAASAMGITAIALALRKRK